MKIYDTFIFNDELDLLELRLEFLDKSVDFFVIVESKRTLSGLEKPLHFFNNKDRYQKYQHKIVYLESPVNDKPAWEYEYFQRNYIKKALTHCKENDWILISDVDEIVNIPYILSQTKEIKPYLIEIPMYYYWLNVKTNSTYFVNLISPWKYIQNFDIGERFHTYPKVFSNRIENKESKNGWHFSYLFGNNVNKYQQKIKSFSHQEYNTTYFLNPNRIRKCTTLCIDLFEREYMSLNKSNKGLRPITPYIKQLQLENYIYKPSLYNFITPENILFILKVRTVKTYKKLRLFAKNLIHNLTSVYNYKSL